jgi:hypothetical protein
MISHWDSHVLKLCNSLTKYFHLFYNIRHLLTDSLKLQLYYSFVSSRITYGIEIYGSCKIAHIRKIQTLQNKLLKVLFNLHYKTSTNFIHSNLKILKCTDMYNVAVLKFTYSVINEISILQFNEYYKKRNTMHSRKLRNQHLLDTPRYNNKFGQTSIRFQGAKLWNGLNDNIRQSMSLYTFKKAIKEFFISKYI